MLRHSPSLSFSLTAFCFDFISFDSLLKLWPQSCIAVDPSIHFHFMLCKTQLFAPSTGLWRFCWSPVNTPHNNLIQRRRSPSAPRRTRLIRIGRDVCSVTARLCWVTEPFFEKVDSKLKNLFFNISKAKQAWRSQSNQNWSFVDFSVSSSSLHYCLW